MNKVLQNDAKCCILEQIMNISELEGKVVKCRILHADNLIAKVIGTLIRNNDGWQLECANTDIVFIQENRCDISEMGNFPMITYNL